MPKALKNHPETTKSSGCGVEFVCNVIGVYNLPPPPSPTPSLPLVTVTVNESTLLTSTPKSKHPVNLSYRYDSALSFPIQKETADATITFKAGVELSSATMNLSEVSISHKNNPEPVQTTLTLKTKTPTNLPPTLRLSLTLTSNYRPEISVLSTTASSYFNLVDSLVNAVSPTLQIVKEKVYTKYALIPLLPVLVTGACLAPVVAGVGIIGLPLFLPLAALAALFTFAAGCCMTVFYFSTESGRSKVNRALGGSIQTIANTRTYQQVVYEFGKRPSAVSMCKTVLPIDAGSRLVLSLLIDFVGSCSYLLPGAGEAFDVFWAPAQTLLLVAMYGDKNSSIQYISFAEEMLPFTDVLPTASLGWLKEHGPEVWEGKIKAKVFKGKATSVAEKRE
ncbi:hypothetical protein TrLO_g4970 [Triparma laevis f. longispina]|uniref:Uncharacterized protein n=1 Tax=Triparma laevis f. longispina TaxID=1714387 RepID=A0A9W7AFN0_9STRA|nr:hypothetical protein TrLO_g4970 [Triparma laevis f. longispina]